MRMTTTWEGFAARLGNDRSLAGIFALAVLFYFLMPFYNVVDGDVAFLTWTANQMLRGAVFGRDILEVNPPLCVLIYMPAVLLGKVIGLEWGVRTWMLILTLASLACLWQTAGRAMRLPVAVVLLLFVTLVFPNHFAQREQIVLLLCAPYVAGIAPNRRWGLLSGIMAGIGFMMKPHFLIPLALIFAMRRRFGLEERAIIAVGAAYAVTLLAFFQPYLLEMVPMAATTYWAIHHPWDAMVKQTAFTLLAAVPMAFAGAPQPVALPYLAATLGFTAAAVLQQKGFVYHFIPAFGFLALYLTVRTFNENRTVAFVSALFLLTVAIMAGKSTLYWRSVVDGDIAIDSALKAEIDGAASYASFVPEPYPAFPMAIHSTSRFVGIAIHQIFIPAVASLATGLVEGDPVETRMLALSQATRELANNPVLVITLNVPYVIDGQPFDILEFFNQDPRFREAWSNYAPDRSIGPFLLYRRR